ncbi:hypothetical protein CC80DRAFT_267770 [Byssothecium circinans]|uniref:Uncharacterized protein n=1 Tax=Byssothecium circinans TaxID=147558 RepID=A0A6A5UDE9_9PLEO|nr:hypothetical protein CC80DRAFT_267770 [Byssothecium circinans]
MYSNRVDYIYRIIPSQKKGRAPRYAPLISHYHLKYPLCFPPVRTRSAIHRPIHPPSAKEKQNQAIVVYAVRKQIGERKGRKREESARQEETYGNDQGDLIMWGEMLPDTCKKSVRTTGGEGKSAHWAWVSHQPSTKRTNQTVQRKAMSVGMRRESRKGIRCGPTHDPIHSGPSPNVYRSWTRPTPICARITSTLK